VARTTTGGSGSTDPSAPLGSTLVASYHAGSASRALDLYAVLDANALLPPRLSDVLMDLTFEGVYQARWTQSIETEYLRNWVRVNKGIKGAALLAYRQTSAYQEDVVKATQRLKAMRGAIGSQYLLYGEQHPEALARVPTAVHKNDRHVAAAALILERSLQDEGARWGECFLISANLRHLAVEPMAQLGVTVCAPGTFLDIVCIQNPDALERALMRTVRSLKAPPLPPEKLLGALQIHGAQVAPQIMSARWECRIDLNV
jgi:hypothetical protein